VSAEFIMAADDPDNRERTVSRLIRFLADWPADKPCLITCELFKLSRSSKQNRALFGLAYKILRDETGHDVDELHDFFCKRFFGTVEYEFLGETRTKPARTTTTNEQGKRDVLPWDRFSEFFESVRTFAASELMVAIPDPDPLWYEKVERKHAA